MSNDPLRPVPSPDGYLNVVRRRLPDRQNTCPICCNETARSSLYEFARAKEVFRTTHISYRAFGDDYIADVLMHPANYQQLMACLNNHIRPGLRREIREMAIEAARASGEEWAPPTLDSFLVAPHSAVERLDRTKSTESMIENDSGEQPEEDPDTVTYPELADTPTRDWHPDNDPQAGRTNLRFWHASGDAAAQTPTPDTPDE